MSAELIPEFHFYTPEEYLALEREAETKSEYLEGYILAMAGGSPNHAAIAANLIFSFISQLRGKPCRAFTSDLKISTPSDSLFAYPDLSVVCGELKLKENRPDVATNPLLIVEVLSPSTEAYDRGKKFRKYREIESFTDYLLVSQEEPSVDHYHKREDGVWTVIGAYGMDGSLYLSSLDVTLPLSEVYDKITFPPPRPFPEEVRMGYDPPTDAEKHPK